MTNEEIKKIKQELYEIQTASPSNEQVDQIVVIAKEIGASLPVWLCTHDQTPIESINFIAKSIHTVLQTEMMLNACASAETSSDLAKRSCKWAAIAAIAAFISAVLTGLAMCLTVYSK